MSDIKYIPRLQSEYKENVIPVLIDKLGLSNVMQVPKILKITLNMGMGDARDNKNSLNQALNELTLITGQKPIVTRARKAISNFKIRQGDPVGISVVLRNNIM